MKVKELIKELQNIKHQDMEILISGDPEGNDFRTIDSDMPLGHNGKYFIIYPTDDIIDL